MNRTAAKSLCHYIMLNKYNGTDNLLLSDRYYSLVSANDDKQWQFCVYCASINQVTESELIKSFN
jgi:hypothetical protein